MHLVAPENLWVVSRYIELNPVRAGIISAPEDYPYSSGKAHLLNRRDPILTDNTSFQDMESYRDFVSAAEAHSEDHLKKIRDVIEQQNVFGPKGFIQMIESKFSWGPTPVLTKV